MKTKTKKLKGENEKKSQIIPIFKTHGSLGRAILTVKKEDEISESGPVSIFSIVKEHKLDKIIITDDTFLSFPSVYKNINPICQVIFGINFFCCNDVKGKGAESVMTESKITILMNNSKGYKDLLRLHNKVHTDPDYLYYHPRVDWETLSDLWTENLTLFLPAYDNFIHNNLLKDGGCLPQFKSIKPVFSWASMELPFDYLLEDAIQSYASNNNFEIIESHPIYYYKEEDLKAYMFFRSVDRRAVFSNPNLDFMTSNQFSFESYLKKTK